MLSPPTATPPVTSSNHININRAPVAVLDHIPGGGRIGLAIARRRPYATIEDLVRKRVLRKTAFERIRWVIAVN
jgi:DNA uptake protein ComE-like DNA-binding protein